MRMIATKSLRYGTRALKAGDLFEAKPRDARILKAVHKARDVNDRDIGELPSPPQSLVQRVGGAEPDMKHLRDEYKEVVGKRAFNGWDAGELCRRIADAKAESAE